MVKESVEGGGNTSKEEVFTWSDKLRVPKQQEDNLDYAYNKLKFNQNVMSMAGRPPVKPGEIVVKIMLARGQCGESYIRSTDTQFVQTFSGKKSAP